MTNWVARVVAIRTTHGGSGRAIGIVTGMGATPDAALTALESKADALAQQLGEQAAEADETAAVVAKRRRDEQAKEAARREALRRNEEFARYRKEHPGVSGRPVAARRPEQRPVEPPPSKTQDDGPRYYPFEVVDVRLMRAAIGDGSGDWLAYGTLVRPGDPRQTDATGTTGGSGGSSGDGGGEGRDDRSGWGGRGTR